MAKQFATTGSSTNSARFTGPSLKQRLRSGQVLVGGIVTEYLRPSIFKIYAEAGFDFAFIENEHGWFDPAMFTASVLAARDAGLPLIAKTPQLERGDVAKLLDSGVLGIQLPRTESRLEVETLHSYLKYVPVGTRAIAPGLGNTGYRLPPDWQAWMNEQNDETTLVVHIETRAGYDRAEEIISTPGVDMVYVGPGDFSIAMGHPGKYEHPEVLEGIEHILKICQRHQVAFGTTAADSASAQRWISKGARFFEAADELSFISAGATDLVQKYRTMEVR